MKLTTFILIITLAQVSAKSFGQKINLDEKNTPIEKVLKSIRQQSGYEFIYNVKDLQNQRISIKMNDVSVEDAVKESIKDLALTYKIVKNNIVLTKIEPSFLNKLVKAFKDIDVIGRVIDDKGQPISGATVQTKDRKRITSTDDHGNFILKGLNDKSIIVITVIGFETKEIPAVANLGDIHLVMATSKLDEVQINAGYYSVTDRERTGNISKITSVEIGKQPVDNPLMALEGRVAGLQITQSTGVAGGGFKVQIRGQNSIKSGNDPLYIIDGVNYPSTRVTGDASNSIFGDGGPNPLSFVNPNDIESIEVLKDADATAIYGSRGANGVILITTKKGTTGNTKINAAISQGFSQVAHKVDLLNTEQYIDMRYEALKNDNLQSSTTDYDINGVWDVNRQTDWQKTLIGGNAQTTNASLNISGGSMNNNYLIAGNYYKEGTVFPGDFGFKRLGLRTNINLGSAQERFNASFTTTFNHIQSDLFDVDLTSDILLPPNSPEPYDQYGRLNWSNNSVMTNPMAALVQTNTSGTDNLLGNLTINYKIFKNLLVKASLGYTRIKREEIHQYPLVAYPPAYGFTSAQRVSYFTNNYNNTFIAEPQITYNTKMGAGIFDALVGLSLQNNYSELGTIRAADFSSDDLMSNISSAGSLTSNISDYSQYRYFATFARLNYSLADKYYLNITARRDGSSKFGPDKQFANFGAAGAGWLFSEERYIKEILPFLTFGKLRASYGITGNDQISDYGYLQLWNVNPNYQGSSTLTPGGVPNVKYSWEINRKIEAAMQLAFLKDKISIEVSFYRNVSSNMLLVKTLPLSTGLGALNENLPAKVENSGLEFEANFKLLKRSNFQWSAVANFTRPRNTLLSYPGLETTADANNYVIGEPLSILKVYNVSVDSKTGAYVIEDKNDNGVIDNGDRYQVKFLGQYYYGGLQNSFKYKQFNLDFQFSFTKQNGRSYRALNSLSPGSYFPGALSNQFSQVLIRWQQPGDNTLVQAFGTSSVSNNLNTDVNTYGNVLIVNASYVKLRNISLAYTLSKKMLSSLKISNAVISLQGQNIFTLTNYVGLDPETQGLRLPPLRTIMAGINITF